MSGSSPTSSPAPGLDYCSLANARSIPVAQELTRRFRDHALARTLGRLHINISGCINACGHHHVGHIGILGVEKNGEEFYQITLGGRADEEAELGTLLGPAVPYGEVADVVEDVVAAYVELRERPDELFIDTVEAARRRAIQGARLCRSLSQAGSSRTAIVRIADDAPVPDGVPVIVPAARFLAEAEALAHRDGADRRAVAEQPADRRARAVSRPARAGRAGVPDLPRRPRLQPGAASCASATASAASCARPARCCATSSCSCCAPASTPSR